MTTFLLGGGWTESAREAVYGPLLAAAGSTPTVACVVLDEGEGAAEFERWAEVLRAVATCAPTPVLVPLGSTLDVAALGAVDAVLVCGGLTPAYASALAPVADAFVKWLGDRPYAGFSAGAAIAASNALVGGWKLNNIPVCAEDTGEDLDEVTIVAGLGLLDVTVEVHAAQWGTLYRLMSAVRSGLVRTGLAIDEDTMLAVDGDTALVAGLGQVHEVSLGTDAVSVRSRSAGETVDLTRLRAG